MSEEMTGGDFSVSMSKSGVSTVLPSFQVAATMASRERFYVELKPDETTVVSWKKLVKDAQKSSLFSACEAPAGAHPALEARIAPEVAATHQDLLPPPPSRFNSVIEKIERLYKGGHSSDERENLSDVPDDDQYDTEDSFIDDEELNEYFSVDKAKTKHSGFFVNRGKLERMSEPVSLPVYVPKKRKRKDIKKLSSETNLEDLPKKLLNSGVRMKAAARKASLSTMVLSSPLEKAQTTLVKQTNQVANSVVKDPKEWSPGSEVGKVTEDCACEFRAVVASTVSNNTVGEQNVKSLSRDTSEAREVTKNVGTEVPRDNLSTVNALEPLVAHKIDASGVQKMDYTVQYESHMRDFAKDVIAVSQTKVKVVQKGVKEDDAREAVVGGGKQLSSNFMSAFQQAKEASPGRPKGTVLERAILDLERGVTELCPRSLVVREPEQASQSGGKSRRLPRDVKQKLAKVARLAAKQGRITDDLIERLMGILGHVMRVKTLKRNMKEMVEMGLSAMQEKEGRLLDIKREVTEMVKSRVSSLQAQDMEQREGSCDDHQVLPVTGERGSMSGQYQWDHATEDRICDLYEQYIEGMDEHRGPQIRKLYAELAELWPEGWMDNIGIKHAVLRAKDRKKQQIKLSICREESRRKQKANRKRKASELGARGHLSLIFNQSCQGQVLPDTARGYDNHHEQGIVNDECQVWPASEEKRKYSRKSRGKGVSSVEKRRNKLEASPLLRKRLRKKLEKFERAPFVSKKVWPTYAAQTSPCGKEVSSGGPLQSKEAQQVAVSPQWSE